MTDATPAFDVPASELYASLRELREHQPVSREDEGPWRVARYEDVRNVLRNHVAFSSDVAQRPADAEERPPSMIFSDPPVHDRLRQLVANAFTPRQISKQHELIEARCEALVRRMSQSPAPDLIGELAAPLPVTVIAHMLGVEDGDVVTFKRWSDAIFSNIGDILMGSASEEAMQAAAEMDAYFLERIAALRRHRQPHLLSHLVHTETDAGRLTDDELLMFCRLLLIAGNETTTSLIVACVRVFHEMPDTFAMLKRAPERIAPFVEETLRFYAPFQATLRRATRDLGICGVTIPKGELVLPLIASANRDERAFERADQFVIDRHPNPHLAFGLGIHSCLGSALARLEGQIAVASLVRHLDAIALTDHDTTSLDEFGAPSALSIRIDRAAA